MTIQLGNWYIELLIVRARTITQIAQRDRLAQLNWGVRIAAPMNTGMDAVAEPDVTGEFVQFAVDVQRSRVSTGIRNGRRSIIVRDQRVLQMMIAIEEKFQNGETPHSKRLAHVQFWRSAHRNLA